ncbi:MAG: dTMP kinase [Firmicutes bacterium]|nr:dTMP kinase [Bacillota bacterium]
MGKFIVIEGMDGSGKSTQTKKLNEYLNKHGYKVKTFHFPSGEGFYGNIVNRFLRGDYGRAEDVDPYFAAFVFAGDRKEMSDTVNGWLEEYDIVLMDRYTFSNIAYQCAKIDSVKEQKKLRDWIFTLEFDIFNIPKPDMSIFLGVPMSFVKHQLGRERVGEERDYLNGKADIHEKDMSLQYRVGEQYRIMCSERDEMVMMDCTNDQGHMLNGDRIHKNIIKLLKEKEII